MFVKIKPSEIVSGPRTRKVACSVHFLSVARSDFSEHLNPCVVLV